MSANAKVRRISNVALSTVKAYTSASKITDPNYGKLHAIREVVETAFLTTQAYKSSYRVASPWINSVQIFLLVLNCWSFTLAERLLRASIGWTRMLCLYIHLCIDITIHIIIPTFLFLPYARVFNPSIGEFGIIFWYTDRWLVRVFNEFPMIFVTSFLDGVTKIFIGASIVRTLLDIPVLLNFIDSEAKQSKDDVKAAKAAAYAVEQMKSEQRPEPAQRSKIERGCRVILLLWGACILALHFHASSHGANPRCLQQVRPWLSRRAACSLAEINCERSKRRAKQLTSTPNLERLTDNG
ncbi:hypothetical protein PINS_up005843 [Pythium insidiosum]|nr:hypothetical protein PINS_up005843 [Pythium insidiosum]